jgi:Ca-activated chloride channel family protein
MVVGDFMITLFSQLFGITCAAPQTTWVFIPIAIMAVLAILWVMRIDRLIKKLVAPQHRAELLDNFSLPRYWIKAGLIIAALLALACSSLRPQWDKKDEQVVNEGRDIIIALDVSRSMLAQDYVPNRLEYAKNKIKTLVKELGAERVGLLVFSGEAVMQCPLTTDYDAFFMFLQSVSVETISSGTTSIGSALGKILRAFAAFDVGRTKLVALFTDGEDFSPNLTGIKQQAIDTNVHIFTIGVGTPEGAPVPLYGPHGAQQGYQKDQQGQVVVSRLNGDLIQQLSTETGGKYVRVTTDNSDVLALKRWIEAFEKSRFNDHQIERLQEKFYYYSGAAFLLLFLEWLL